MAVNISRVSPRSFGGKLLRMPLKAIPTGTVLPILQGRLQGKKWVVGSSIHGCWLGTYELAKQERFISAVEPGWTVYDVGANVGYYSVLASNLVGTQGIVHAFEPTPRNLGFLRQHIALNGCSNVNVFEAAVTDYCGTAHFDNTRSGPTGFLDDKGPLAVKVLTLDSLLAEGVAGPDCIKMDIEGAEYKALTGAREILAKHHPVIFLATHGREIHEQCLNLLTEFGYRFEPLPGKHGDTLADTDEIFAF
jgi:FkbM family methyltransferase